MHGFLSRDGLPPGDLLAAGRDEVQRYCGEIIAGAVTELEPCNATGFWVLLADGERVSARRLLVSTGLRDELPDIPGLTEQWYSFMCRECGEDLPGEPAAESWCLLQ